MQPPPLPADEAVDKYRASARRDSSGSDHHVKDMPVAGYAVVRTLSSRRGAKVSLVQNALGQTAALKCFVVDNEADRLRWRREILGRHAAAMHPSVLGILDAGVCSAGHHYVLTPFIEGSRLTQWWTTGRTPTELFTVLAELAKAVGDLHRLGIVHADLKPDNVLIRDDNRPMIIDLASSYFEPAERNYIGEYTRPYMAPELAGSTRYPSTSSDVYALGAIACALCLGTLPRDNSSLSDRTALSSMETSMSGASRPVALLDFIRQSLSETPSDRPSAEEAEFAFRRASAESLTSPEVGMNDELTVQYEEDGCVQEIRLSRGQAITVGRGSSADIIVGDDVGVSRQVMAVSLQGDGIMVHNQGTQRAIWVEADGGRSARIGPGDRVQLGASKMSIRFDGIAVHSLSIERCSPPIIAQCREPTSYIEDDTPDTLVSVFELSERNRRLVAAYAAPLLEGSGSASATHAEVAGRLGRSVYTVRNRLHALMTLYRYTLGDPNTEVTRDDFCRHMIESRQVRLADVVARPVDYS